MDRVLKFKMGFLPCYMLNVKTLSILILLLHHQYSTSVARGDEEKSNSWSMVEKKGKQFMVDGEPFYVNGFNTYWLMILAVDESTRGKVSEVFQQASGVGLSVCRTWAFNDGQWRALQKAPNVYDEQVFKVYIYSCIVCLSKIERTNE